MVKKPWVARTLPWPAQVGQVSGIVAGFRARAVAGLAGHHGGHLDLGAAAAKGFFQA